MPKILANNLQYKISKSKRAKNIRLSVKSDASVILTIPRWLPVYFGKSFLDKKMDWVLATIAKRKEALRNIKPLTKSDYLEHKDKAKELVLARLAYFNKLYQFQYNKIVIRNQKTRWGSCSSLGNLNFSYKLVFLSDKEVDYIVVHELCHLKEMNHSASFWRLVAQTIPDYKNIRRDLRKKALKFV